MSRLQGVGLAAGIALVAAGIQGARLPAVLDGFGLQVALGKASDPHLITGLLDRAILTQCSLSAPCVQHWNVAIFAFLVFAIGALSSRWTLGLLATTVVAISPLAAALVVDPLGASLSVGIFLVAAAAIDVTGIRSFPLVPRCALAVAIVLVDPALAPAALVYGALGGVAPLACAVAATALRFLLVHPNLDPLAGPATLVAFGCCIFIGGPLLMLAIRHRAFRWLADDGRALLRATTLALAALAGGLLASSGDVAPYWLASEAAALIGLVASLRSAQDKAFERAAIGLTGLLVVQFGLFLQHHEDVTSAAIAYRGDDLRGMLAASSQRACVASDDIADRYVLAGGAFLHHYPPRIAPLLTGDPANCLSMPDGATIVTMTGLAVNNWGNAVALMKAYRDAADPVGALQIEGGAVLPATPAKTPTGRGSFGNEIDTPLGHVGDFTIVSGYTYVPACQPVVPGKHLVFSAASVPGTPALRIRIAESATGGTHTLLDTPFPASSPGEPYHWIRYVLPVDENDCASFSFSVSKGGPNAGNWLTFAGASIR